MELNTHPLNSSNGSDPAMAGLAKAVSAHLKGEPAAALAALEMPTSDAPSPELLAARAYLRLEMKQYAEAAAEYQALLEARPGYGEGHYQRGVCLSQLGRSDEALVNFTRSAELDPAHADASLGAGICLLNLKRPEEALDYFRKCLEKSPNLEAALLGKAVALQLTWELDEAIDIYRAVLQKNPRCEDALVNMVALGMQRKDYGLTRTCGEELLVLNPASQPALEGLSAAAFAREAFGEAADFYERLTGLFPRNYDYWFNLGVAHQRGGNATKAASAYTQAAVLRRDLAAPQINLAVLHNSSNDTAAARAAIERALEIAPERDDLRYHYAVTLEQQGNLDQAEGIYSELAARNPGDENVQFRLGYLKLERGDAAGAAAAFEACLRKRAQWNDAEVNLGLAYWKSGQADKAREALENLLAREPGSVDAVRGLAVNALAQDDSPQALKWHQRLQELGDRSAEVLHNTGLLLFRRGDLAGAIRNYRDAVAAKPDFAEAILNLGHACEASGLKQEARENWARALELKPVLAQGYFLPA